MAQGQRVKPGFGVISPVKQPLALTRKGLPGRQLVPFAAVLSGFKGWQMTLDEIRALVATDLEAVDGVIRTRLQSAVPLVSQVAEHIVAGGGKRLRPLIVLLSA